MRESQDAATKNLAGLQWWVLLATVAITPLAFSTWTIDVFNLTALTVLWLGLVVAVGLQIALGPAGRCPLPRVWVVVATYVGILVLTTVTSRAPLVSAFGSYGRYGGLATTVPAIAAAWLLVGHLAGSTRRQRQLAGALAISAGLGAAYLWAQQAGIDAFDWLEPWRTRPRHPPGALGNSNFSGAHLALAIGPVAYLAITTAGHRRVAWTSLGIVVLSGIAVSQSRGAMMAAAVGLIAIAATSSTNRRVVGAGAFAAMVVVGAIALLANAGGLDELSGAATWGERVDLWEVALRGAADRPVLGGGPDLYALTFADHAGPDLSGVVSNEPHNVLFDQLDGSGFVGAAAWLSVVAALVWLALHSIDHRALPPWSAMGLAYLTQAMVSIDVVPLQLWGWVAAAGVAAVAEPALARRDTKAEATTRKATRWAAGVVAAAALGILAVAPFRADMAHRRGIEASNAGDNDRAIAQLRQATDRHAWEPRFHRRLGIQLSLAGNRTGDPATLAEARAELDRALELLPHDRVATEWRATLGD